MPAFTDARSGKIVEIRRTAYDTDEAFYAACACVNGVQFRGSRGYNSARIKAMALRNLN